MASLVIAQDDKKIRGTLTRYRDRHFDRFLKRAKLGFKLDFDILRSPRGESVSAVYASSANRIVGVINTFAEGQLRGSHDDVVQFRIVFMFHQTSKKTVTAMTKAMRILSKDAKWRNLPFAHTRHLRVEPVVLLSCESGMDRGFQPGPNPPSRRQMALRGYAKQAADMKVAAAKAFVTPMAPPPARPRSWYDPSIITFTTGDPDTGGIELNPFGMRFRKLPGRFRPDGRWSYDPTPAGEDQDTFRSGRDTAGTVNVDHVHAGSTQSVPVPSGQPFPVIP